MMTIRFIRAWVVLGLAGVALTAAAQQSRLDIAADANLAGSNYVAYRGPQKPQTATPEGYTPYYISHYGRHGSRYLIGASAYDAPYFELQRADSLGKLTEVGRTLLDNLGRIRAEATLRDGELTPLGAQQHHAIARRMYERFPEVLAGAVDIDARSTIVIRCILSMENALQELASLNPRLRISHDASHHDMYYMNDGHSPYDKLRDTPEAKAALKAFNERHMDYSRLMRQIFNDAHYADTVDANKLGDRLMKIAANVQSTELRHTLSLWPLFSADEIYNYWLRTNAFWYMYYGASPQTNGAGMYMQTNLLRNIVATADSCLQLPHPGATLRYGHEVNVMPLVCLMNLNGYGERIDDLEDLDDRGWLNYNIYPMGCNVQLVFYRPTALPGDGAGEAPVSADSVLVKVLLNEDEASLPIATDRAPYYRWSDVRAYLMGRLGGQ